MFPYASTAMRMLGALALSAVSCFADPIDRENTAVTGSIWLPSADVAELTTYTNQNWRIVNLEVTTTNPVRFTACLVPNTGSYAIGWWWYPQSTSLQLNAALQLNNARMIDIEPYVVSGTRYYAGVMVSNAGSNFKSTNVFFSTTASSLASHTNSQNMRITDLDGFDDNGTRRYSAITLSNTGEDARGWWWYYGITSAQVDSFVSTNRARLVDLERDANGNFECVMVSARTDAWWYFYDVPESEVSHTLMQYGARPISLKRRFTLNGYRYDITMLNASNALSFRVGEILRNGTNGFSGAYLRRVGSATSTLAAVNSSRVFEPASTMKTLHHVGAMRRVEIGQAALNENIVTRLGKSGSCPTGGGSSANETLETALRLMMEQSDNCRTRSVEERFTRLGLLGTAAVLGMNSTGINHTLGCGTLNDQNTTTLEDLGRLHHQVATGYLGSERDNFYNLMVNSLTYPTVGSTSIQSIISSERSSLGLSSSTQQTFLSLLTYAAKGGNYNFPSQSQYTGTYFGFLSLPVISQDRLIYREYAVGTFFNAASSSSVGFQAIGSAYLELLRGEIRSALATWVGADIGVISYLGSACSGTAGAPTFSISGSPEISDTLNFELGSVPIFASNVLALGVSTTNWNGLPLPFSLTPLGAAGCFFRVDQLITIPGRTTLSGTRTYSIGIPNDRSLLGAVLAAQYLVLDSGANNLGLTTTRAARIVIGVDLP